MFCVASIDGANDGVDLVHQWEQQRYGPFLLECLVGIRGKCRSLVPHTVEHDEFQSDHKGGHPTDL